jgi:undecaprenyl-diphosphatase
VIQLGELIKSVILGIVEGITEFLPVSSTGHLIAASALLDFQSSIDGTFEIFIQLGAVLAVVLFYRAELITQVKTVTQDMGVQRLWLAVIVAVIPAAILGFLFRDFVKATLFTPVVVAVSLIVGGFILIVVERWKTASQDTGLDDMSRITRRQAILIGVAQVIALIPGVSRSGASIIGGMLVGLKRETATRFSFWLAIPTLGGATIADLILSLDEIASEQVVYLLVGLIVSALVAWLAIRWLLNFVAHNNFIPFGYYRIIAGVALLVLAAGGAI